VFQDIGKQAVSAKVTSQEATVHLRARTECHRSPGDPCTHFSSPLSSLRLARALGLGTRPCSPSNTLEPCMCSEIRSICLTFSRRCRRWRCQRCPLAWPSSTTSDRCSPSATATSSNESRRSPKTRSSRMVCMLSEFRSDHSVELLADRRVLNATCN
jgi:hypothetical protein